MNESRMNESRMNESSQRKQASPRKRVVTNFENKRTSGCMFINYHLPIFNFFWFFWQVDCVGFDCCCFSKMGFTNCGAEDFGLFATVEKIKRAFPCEGTHISARMVGLVAEVQVVQFYVNHSHTPLNAKYSFPLDESAGLCGLEAELGDRLLIGEVKEKEEARRESVPRFSPNLFFQNSLFLC